MFGLKHVINSVDAAFEGINGVAVCSTLNQDNLAYYDRALVEKLTYIQVMIHWIQIRRLSNIRFKHRLVYIIFFLPSLHTTWLMVFISFE